MPIDLARSTVFNLTGTILPSNGVIPSFERPSAAYVPFVENRSYYLKESNIHEPRFLLNGGLLLEPGTVNLIGDSMNLQGPSWVIGSQVQVNTDLVLSMTKNYLADKISASAGGSVSSHSIYQTLQLRPGFYTLSVYMTKIAGVVSSTDRLYVLNGDFLTGGVPNTNELDGLSLDSFWGADQAFKDDDRKFKRVLLQFSVGTESQYVDNGDPVSYAVNVNTDVQDNSLTAATASLEGTFPVTIALSLGGGGSTLGIAGFQLEALPFPTSFIESTLGTASRAGEKLVYPQSPFAATGEGSQQSKDDWTLRFTLDEWEGDGIIFRAGSVTVDIFQGRLRVVCGPHTLTDTSPLGQSSQVIVRNASGHSLRLYVDYQLRAQTTFTVNQSFKASAGVLDMTPTAVRVIRDMIVLNEAVPDEIPQVPTQDGVNVNLATTPITIPGMLNCLFLLDYKLPISENKGRFVFTPIQLRPRETAFIRFPQTRLFSDTVTQNPGAATIAGVAQQVVCEVITPGYSDATVNAFEVREWITIEGIQFTGASGGSVKTWLVKKQDVAAAIVDQIETAIAQGELRNVSVTYTAEDADFLITSTVAGLAFTLGTSIGIGQQTIASNGPVRGVLNVSFPNEFSLGRAYIQRNYKEIAAVNIVAKSVGAGTITVDCNPGPLFAAIRQGDVVFQPSSETLIAPANYYADTLQDIEGIKVVAKSMNGFILENTTSRTVSPVTPLIKMFF